MYNNNNFYWSRNDVEEIKRRNQEIYNSDLGKRMLKMLKHFQGGDRTGPNSDSPIWILEILQNAIDAGASVIKIYFLKNNDCIITHNNENRIQKGITLNELNALCNISATTKSLTSVGFFGIGFKSIFYVFKKVSIVTRSALNGYVKLEVGGTIPLERSDLLKSVLPIWMPGSLNLPNIELFDNTFYFQEWRFDSSPVSKSFQNLLGPTSLLRPILRAHGVENLSIYTEDRNEKFKNLINSSENEISHTFSVQWRPSNDAFRVLQQLRDIDDMNDIQQVNNYCALINGVVKIPLTKNTPNSSFVFCTFPTHDETGLSITFDGPFLLDANRLHLRWESGCRDWNEEILSFAIPEILYQFAEWIPSYLNKVNEDQFHKELNAAINILLSMNKSRKRDFSESRDIQSKLSTVFLSLPERKKTLFQRLFHIPFLPVTSKTNENTNRHWVSPNQIIWPTDMIKKQEFNELIEKLPHSYIIWPNLPSLEQPQMTLLFYLRNEIASEENLKTQPSSMASLIKDNIKKWFSSFESKEEKIQALKILCEFSVKNKISIPCVPCFLHSNKAKKIFTFNSYQKVWLPTTNSQFNLLIESCVENGFQYYQFDTNYEDLLKEEKTISLESIDSIKFVNSALSHLNDEVKFNIALQFMKLKNNWVVVEDNNSSCCLEEIEIGRVQFSPFPPNWIPVKLQEISQQFIDIYQSNSESILRYNYFSDNSLSLADIFQNYSKKVIRLDPRLYQDENDSLLLKKQLFKFPFEKVIIEKTIKTKDEKEARSFAEPYLSEIKCTGWSSKKGYYLTDWTLSPDIVKYISNYLPYFLLELEPTELIKTFYRSATCENFPSGNRPSQWVRDVIQYLPEWAKDQKLIPLIEKIIVACEKECNLVNKDEIFQEIGYDNYYRSPMPDIDELRRRNQVLRAFFEGHTWSKNLEFNLKRIIVAKSKSLFPDYPLIIEDEWEIEANRTDLGRGDLVLASSNGQRVAIVELKANKSSTIESVREQAIKYAEAYYNKMDVISCIAYIVMFRGNPTEIHYENVFEIGNFDNVESDEENEV